MSKEEIHPTHGPEDRERLVADAELLQLMEEAVRAMETGTEQDRRTRMADVSSKLNVIHQKEHKAKKTSFEWVKRMGPGKLAASVVGALMIGLVVGSYAPITSFGASNVAIHASSDSEANIDMDMAGDDHADDGGHAEEGDTHAMAVPEDASAVVNPFSGDSGSAANGSEVFSTNCVSCHGALGLGDGPIAESLTPPPADLSTAHLQELSDGAIFYLISTGKEGTSMPAWNSTLSEDDRWALVNHIRDLKAK